MLPNFDENCKINEYEDLKEKLMSVESFEYLDLDEDGVSEIFIVADTNANSKPLVDVLCLKLSNGQWSLLDLPRNMSTVTVWVVFRYLLPFKRMGLLNY